MPKQRRNPNPLEQYDRFMNGTKTPATVRGVVNVAGALIGNSVLWLTRLITVARLGLLLAFVLTAAVTLGILQRLVPAPPLATLLVISAAVAVLLVGLGMVIVNRMLKRDAQRLGQQPTFGVFEDDARVRDRKHYRRKAGR